MTDTEIAAVCRARQWMWNEGVWVRQRLDEFLAAFDFITENRDLQSMRRLVEIGTFNGGWLALAAPLFPPGCEFITIDPKPQDGFPQVCERLQITGRNVSLLQETAETAAGRLCGETIDLLHVDGLHRAPNPENDWRAYRPLLKPGGVAIFHDTGLPPVGNVFKSLLETYPGREFKALGPVGLGVGVLLC